MLESTVLVAIASAIVWIVRQVRIGLRDREDRKFVRHVFDQTRSPEVLPTLVRLRESDRQLNIGRLQVPSSLPTSTSDPGPPANVG